jgi:hypothetical protein
MVRVTDSMLWSSLEVYLLYCTPSAIWIPREAAISIMEECSYFSAATQNIPVI